MCSPTILWVGIPRVAYGTYVEILNGLGFPKLDLSRPKILHRNSPDEPEVPESVGSKERVRHPLRGDRPADGWG